MTKFQALAASVLIGCAATPASAIPILKHKVAYDRAETAWAFKPGTATISGQADWIWNRRRPCTSMELIPDSAYARETFSSVYGDVEYARIKAGHAKGGYRKHDSRFYSDRFIVQCDAAGNFSFKNVPAGTYYLTTTFLVIIHYNPSGQRSNANEVLMKRVSVAEGQQINIDLRDSK